MCVACAGVLALIDRNFQGFGKCVRRPGMPVNCTDCMISSPLGSQSIYMLLRLRAALNYKGVHITVFTLSRELFTDAGKYVIHFGSAPAEAAQQVPIEALG